MAYQFVHVEGYGREAGKGKRGHGNIDDVVAEAERKAGHCPHVEAPRPPVVLYGVTPSEAASQARAWAETATDARGHRLRKDGLALLGGVVSAPSEGLVGTWSEFKDRTILWLHRRYGDRLKSVIEHTDEARPHIHFYVVPKARERFDDLHEGLAAARAANPARGRRGLSKETKRELRNAADAAYRAAMKKFQDNFYEFVSRRFGLLRYGPGRARLPRAVHLRRIEAAKALADQIRQTDSEVWSALTPAEQEAVRKRIAARDQEAARAAAKPRGKAREGGAER